MARIIVITGTDTGVGKTVFTALLARHLHESGLAVAALKPICSGGRNDARLLRRAAGSALPLDEVNPRHFRAALAPLAAARREGAGVALREVIAHVHRVSLRFSTVLVEGAGGLLSPLGEGFATRELISGLGAEAILVAANRLGAVNHVRLTLEALPPLVATRTRVVLMEPPRADAASRSNPELLTEFVGAERLFPVPWLQAPTDFATALRRTRVRHTLEGVYAG